MTPELLIPLVQSAYLLVFAALAAVALLRWRPRWVGQDGGAEVWLSAAFATIALVTVLDLLVTAPSESAGGVDPTAHIELAALTFVPYFLLRFLTSFSPISATWERLAAVATFVVAIWSVLTPPHQFGAIDSSSVLNTLQPVAFVGLWTFISTVVVVHFWRAGQGQPGVVRWRMRLISVGIAGMIVVLPLAAPGAGPKTQITSSLFALLGACVVSLGYMPPNALRTLWRRREQDRLRQAIGELMAATTAEETRIVLLPNVVGMLGARGAALVSSGGNVLACERIDADTAAAAGAALAEHEGQQMQQPHVNDRGTVRMFASMATGPIAACHLGDDWLVAFLGPITPFLGDEEDDILEVLAALSEIALARAEGVSRLREREAQLAEAQQIAQIGSWEWDPASGVARWSHTLYDLFNIQPEDLTDVTYGAYIGMVAEDDRERVDADMRQAVSHRRGFEFDHGVVTPEGAELTVATRGTIVLDERGKLLRVVGTVQDITARKAAEEALRIAFEQERELATRLQSLDAMKNDILAAVSHELRTPLTSIIGFAETLKTRSEILDNDTREQVYDHLLEQSRKLERLLTDLLDLDRLRRGILLAKRAEVQVDRAIEAVVAGIPANGRTIELELEPLLACIDGPKFERIVENLVANAVKYTPPNATVTVRCSRTDMHECPGLLLEVSDSGAGIPDDLKDSIFEPFHRGGAGLSHAPGTGIGLALVSNFAQLHGGRAWVEDSEVGGARFQVFLPATPDRDPVDGVDGVFAASGVGSAGQGRE